mgnify:CR=1 FL=1|tara:strand:- start:169 stop:498 length:330 start_codon:yes stop_codon:yes gene_type:complete
MKVEKPWGHEIRWAITDKYLGKILHINRGRRLSKQYHEVKDETIYVLTGVLILEIDDTQVFLKEGESHRIRAGQVHRFCAPIDCSVRLIEVSTGEIEDVVRLEDDYGRS